MKAMVAAIKNGDEGVFRDCFFCYQKKLFSYFRKKSVSEEDALDMVQSVFLKLWQYRHSLNEDYEIGQQIFHIARTQFIDYLRVQNKMQYKLSGEAIEAPVAVNDPSREFDIKQKLQQALDRMPEMRKQVFELNRLKGYSYLEIANMYSISVKSVDNHITKAVRHLRQVFGYISVACLFFL